MHFTTTPMAMAMTVPGALSALQSCSSNVPLSCHNSTAVPDASLCCFNAPGGLLVQTQFWDTDPATGPDDSWTIHGLWPDNCDGSYEQSCDSSRKYSNISAILNSQGREDLVDYMKQYWVDINGDDENLWAHEFQKHGTCVNTLSPSCYDNYKPQQEVGDYFQKTVDLFKSLDTYKALANAGITPDSSKTYDLSKVESALAKLHDGHEPTVSCENGAINQAWYFFNVQGNAVSGEYKATGPVSDSNCPKSVKYLPKQS